MRSKSLPIITSVKELKKTIRKELQLSEEVNKYSRGAAINAIIELLEQLDAPTDYMMKSEENPPKHYRPIATIIVDKVRQYTDKSMYRMKFIVSKDTIKAIDDGKTVGILDLKKFMEYVHDAIIKSTKENPWGEEVMKYEWQRIV